MHGQYGASLNNYKRYIVDKAGVKVLIFQYFEM